MIHILMPINPKPLSQILNGEKTVEIRKRIPECLKRGKPITVWGYCTKAYQSLFFGKDEQKVLFTTKKCVFAPLSKYKKLNGLVVCKFVVEKYDEVQYDEDGYADKGMLNRACISQDQFDQYAGERRPVYALHITSLGIIEPMKLGEFGNWKLLNDRAKVRIWKPLTKAPQSWMYVLPPKEGEGK